MLMNLRKSLEVSMANVSQSYDAERFPTGNSEVEYFVLVSVSVSWRPLSALESGSVQTTVDETLISTVITSLLTWAMSVKLRPLSEPRGPRL